MKIDLTRLAYLDDLQLFKTIISSADRFPGLYRIDPQYGNLLEREEFLRLIDLLEVQHLAESQNRSWSRDEWLSAHEIISKLSYGPGGRNEQRTEGDVKALMRERYDHWVYFSKRLSFCVVDTFQRVQEIKINKTYYLMGSLLHFSADKVFVAYEAHGAKYSQALNVSFVIAAEYIHRIFSTKSLSELFWRAEVVAHLNFAEVNEGPNGVLDCDPLMLAETLGEFHPGSPVIAAVNDGPMMPIQYAKFIGVTRVNQRFV